MRKPSASATPKSRQAPSGLAPFDRSAAPIVAHLIEKGFVEQDGEFLFIGPAAEATFGRRHFMEMTSVFTAPPQFTVLRGDLTPAMWRAGTTDAQGRLRLPDIDERALRGLKFNEALPDHLASATLSARLADVDNASTTLSEPVRFLVQE